jgi:hypothetical protein
MKTNKTLIVIAGAAGEIGTSYSKKLVEEGVDVVAIIRNKKVEGIKANNFVQVKCNLDDSVSIKEAMVQIDIESYEKVTFLHTIGVDKFNPRNYPNISKLETIDPDVYDTNVNSFKYLLRYLMKRVATANDSGKSISMKTAIIAGVADKYAPFVIEDFCEAKLILRGYMRSYVDIFPEWFSGLAINITSTVTKSALAVRPNAETKDWLTPEGVVERSFDELRSDVLGYKEIDIVKFSKNFIAGYYENDDLLYNKWSKETGVTT